MGKESTILNKAIKSEHYYARGFLNPITLLNRINFNTLINIIINFLYNN
jgi:hypothetical protein